MLRHDGSRLERKPINSSASKLLKLKYNVKVKGKGLSKTFKGTLSASAKVCVKILRKKYCINLSKL